jgi:hypothetical protein
MLGLVKRLTSSVIVPLGWTVFTIILLCMPGSAFPGGGFLDIPHLDKVVHVILFGGVTIFWCLYFSHRSNLKLSWRTVVVAVAAATIILGICMEVIQFNFIPNRAFDTGDIAANTISAVVFAVFFYFRR